MKHLILTRNIVQSFISLIITIVIVASMLLSKFLELATVSYFWDIFKFATFFMVTTCWNVLPNELKSFFSDKTSKLVNNDLHNSY